MGPSFSLCFRWCITLRLGSHLKSCLEKKELADVAMKVGSPPAHRGRLPSGYLTSTMRPWATCCVYISWCWSLVIGSRVADLFFCTYSVIIKSCAFCILNRTFRRRVRKPYPRMFYRCLTHGALIRKTEYLSGGVFERTPERVAEDFAEIKRSYICKTNFAYFTVKKI